MSVRKVPSGSLNNLPTKALMSFSSFNAINARPDKLATLPINKRPVYLSVGVFFDYSSKA